MSTSYDGYVERYPDGICLAQLVDLPGCFARGTALDECVQNVAAAIPAYYGWLVSHDAYTPLVQGPFAVVQRELQPATPAEGAFYSPDAAPVTVEDLDWYLALLDWVTADLVALPRVAPGRVSAQILDLRGADGRSARAALLDAGLQFRRGLAYVFNQPEPRPPTSADPLGWLDEVVKSSLGQLRATNDEQRARIVERDERRWSLRSVLRQVILNARMQLTALEATRTAWRV